MVQPSDGGKGAVALRKRGAGGFSLAYKGHNEHTVHVETSLIWKAIPDDAASSSSQGAEHMPSAPQLEQEPRQLSWALPDRVGRVKPGQEKTEEMLTLSHDGCRPRLGTQFLPGDSGTTWAGLLGADDGSAH